MNKTKEPRVVYCKAKHKDLYDGLLKESLFSGFSLAAVFVLAMTIGFYRGRRLSLSGQKKDIIRTEYLRQQENIIKSIAVATEKKLEILADKKEVYSIAEEYAAGGIELLWSLFETTEFGSPDKRLEDELRSVVNSFIKH